VPSQPTTRTSRWTAHISGIVALVALWVLCSELLLRNKTAVPAPWDVVSTMMADRNFYRPHISQTLYEALWGYVWGNALAFVLGAVFVVLPLVERLAQRLVVAVYCLPLIATAPILQIIFPGDQAKVAVAAQAVFFTTLVGVTVGLRSAQSSHLLLVRAAGGAVQQLIRVRLRSAIPSVTAALKIAAPSALLGAVIGEFLGGTRGIGVAMIASQQAFNVTRTWGLAMVLTLLSIVLYTGTGWVGKRLTRWEATTIELGEVFRSRTTRSLSWRAASSVAYLIGSIAFAVGVWALLLRVFRLNSFFAKRPDDVWRYLTGPGSATVRSGLWTDLETTFRNAGLGYLAGTIGALALAIAVTSNRAVEQAVMPIAVSLRSVPLVAMTPLVALIVGRGLACVLVIAGIVTFFPGLVQIADGLRSCPSMALDAVHAFGGGQRDSLWKVRLPYALPSLCASARIGAPLAIIGATLAEWLATGKGVGNRMVLSLSRSNYLDLWATVAVLTACAVVVYSLASMVEGMVLRRFHGT
jgi:sulfonate transport system permease protein